ncbi:helix-turn-helix domain-containing protein [Nocardiopsis alba]|uniref:helix-turn-helix domain-containing protein n=1 Tax=Nocardiopsis alba TaxID=53437 RepID=UPI0035D9FFEC
MARPSIDLGSEAAAIGKAVRARRERLKESREAFAKRAKVSPRMLQTLENGESTKFVIERLERIEDAAGWESGSILGRMARGEPPIERSDVVDSNESTKADPGTSADDISVEAVGEEIVQHIYRDLAVDTSDLSEEEAAELTRRALEHARAQVTLFVQAERARKKRSDA